MVRPRFTNRSPLAVESLERRDCPAAVAVLGGGTIAEGGDSTVLTVRLSAPDTKPVQVGYIVSGDGTTPAAVAADYQLSIGTRLLASPSGTIDFKPGETVKQIRLAAIDDALREGAESLRFKLFRAVGCTIDAASSSVDVTVRDNDDYTAALVPQGPNRIAEGASASFVVELSKPATKAETFYVSTQDGTATTADYRPLRDMPVTILPGQSRSQPFAVNTVKDTNTAETDEYFLVSARPRSSDVPSLDPFGVTIIGTRPAAIALVVADTSVKEGDAGVTACTWTVRLTAPALDPITVQYNTAAGTATSGVDFVATQGSLVFSRGQISKTVTINVIGETIVEDDETFQLIATPVGGVAPSATGTATILDDDSAFQIVVTFPDSSLTTAQQEVFRNAAKRWSQIIVGDLPDVVSNGRVIDDLEITASAALLGPGLLGQAQPTAFRNDPRGLPYEGVMQFSTTYVASMMADGTFKDVISHEMGHVLGIGSLWSPFGLISGYGGTDPQFTGAHAVAAYRSLVSGGSSPTSVPVENMKLGQPGKPGDGSYAGHWRESLFINELMTSVAERAGTPMPISRLTIGSLQDLGYAVNYAAADPYVLTAGATAAAARSVTAVPANRQLLALLASSGSDLLAAALSQFATDSTSSATPRQRAFASSVRG